MVIPDPIYGQIKITEPVLAELIQSSAMQRLKGVDQNVTVNLIPVPWKPFSRFDHSVGVMHLIKLLGGNLEEQTAGLLHDISHTAFSHAVDFVFDQAMTQEFHEEHLVRIITRSDIPAILHTYNFDVQRITNHHNFSILEQELPALCADRIDYALKTFYSNDLIPVGQIKQFLDFLKIHADRIVFDHLESAKTFSLLFMKAENLVWGGSARANLAYHFFSQTAKSAYQRGIVTLDDFFTTDKKFLNKLDDIAKTELLKLRQIKFIEVEPGQPYDLNIKAKIRYVDPPVLTGSRLANLSEIDKDFQAQLTHFLERRKAGNYVKILK